MVVEKIPTYGVSTVWYQYGSYLVHGTSISKEDPLKSEVVVLLVVVPAIRSYEYKYEYCLYNN